MTPPPLSWLQIARLGLVQTGLGAIVVLTTSTLNRIMVVELALPAFVPGALVAVHYALQLMRPRLGHGSDVGGRVTPWILGGMTLLALGGLGAAVATAWMGSNLWAGIALAVLSFVLIGIGVGACGTTLLVLLAKRVAAERRAAAATIVWVMMITGFVVTTAVAGHLLDPYSPGRLVAVAAGVSAVAFAMMIIALWGVEGPRSVAPAAAVTAAPCQSFFSALSEVWKDAPARRFAIFIFLSMLAYSAPELILEPFAGSVFGFTPGESTALASMQHGGTLAGMILVASVVGAIGRRRKSSMQAWTIVGCIASAAALVGLAAAGLWAPLWPLRATVFALGLGNGVYAVAAIGSMMGLAGAGQKSREGVRMGLWGAAQATAFGLGSLLGTVAVDVAHHVVGASSAAYAMIFVGEAAMFLVAAIFAAGTRGSNRIAASPFAHSLSMSEAARS